MIGRGIGNDTRPRFADPRSDDQRLSPRHNTEWHRPKDDGDTAYMPRDHPQKCPALPTSMPTMPRSSTPPAPPLEGRALAVLDLEHAQRGGTSHALYSLHGALRG